MSCEHNWKWSGMDEDYVCLNCCHTPRMLVGVLEQQIDEACESLEFLYNFDVNNKEEIIDKIFIKFGKRNKQITA